MTQTKARVLGCDTYLTPAFSENAVPVVFAANDKFVPFFAVCLRSVIETASEKNNYDIVLIQTDISGENRKTLLGMTEEYKNISLRFFDASELLRKYDLKAGGHISVETYFRFLIEEIVPDYDKVLYLDSDIIVNADTAELYNTDIDGYLLAAAHDPEFSGHLNGADRKIQRYILKKLRLKNPENYFQAGVLLINTKEMRKICPVSTWLERAEKPYMYNDQDVLNIYCQGNVKFLDMAWNVLTDCNHTRVSKVISHAPAKMREKYEEARKSPKIIHYAGFLKPWHKEDEDFAEYFWKTAEKTPYYEKILDVSREYAENKRAEEEKRAKSPYWRLRRWAKKLLKKNG